MSTCKKLPCRYTLGDVVFWSVMAALLAAALTDLGHGVADHLRCACSWR